MQKRLPLPAGTVLQNRYRILRQLGRGGMGVVYEAADDELGLSFALKETFADDEAMRLAFKREARMLASVSHEAFPRVTHYFTEMDGCFLVMELIRGDDLDSLLSRQSRPFEPEQVLKWADQILDALEDLHSQGIIHRDIKPSNLKLTPRGKIKLLDFGIAKGALGSETTAVTTVGSLAAATLQYAPLEQVLRASLDWYEALSVSFPEKTLEILQNGTDARSDLYALGATLYQLLTDRLPVNAPTRALTLWAGKPDKNVPAREINPQISESLSLALQRAMEIDRRNRPSSASEMRQMLRDAASPKIVDAPPVPETKAFEMPKQTFFSAPKSAVTRPADKNAGNKILVNFDAPASPEIPPVAFRAQSPQKSGSHKTLWLILPAIILLLGGALGMWRLQSSEKTSEKVPKAENGAINPTTETKTQPPEITPTMQANNQSSNPVRSESRNAQPPPQSNLAAKPAATPQTETKTTINSPPKSEPQRAMQATSGNRQAERTQPPSAPKPEIKQTTKTGKKKKSGDCIFTDDCN